MASGTYDLNDLSVQATTHINRHGRTVLTVTDGTDVSILIGGEQMRQAIREAIMLPVLVPGPDEVVIVARQLRQGHRFQVLGSEKWHTAVTVGRPDAFCSVEVRCDHDETIYLDVSEQVLVSIACEGSDMPADVA